MSQTQTKEDPQGEKEENNSISVWPILGGALLAGGAAAAFPLTGPGALLALFYGTGTVAVASATAGTALGAAAGAATAMNQKNSYDSDSNEDSAKEKEDSAKEKSEHIQRMERLNREITDFVRKHREKDHYFDKVLALVAVGMAAAKSDGKVCEEESQVIEQFVIGISSPYLPTIVKNKIKYMKKTPPSLHSAYYRAQEFGVPMALCEEVINVVIQIDDKIHPNERAFLTAWRQLAAA
ncbi:MAG: hypothetical protein OXC17_10440 [Aestuariivita sp.]|nr:hypothetical protein [Aestuariivita sp.]